MERAQVRCPACRSVVYVTVLWAIGDICPCCSQPLYARRRPNPDAVPGQTLALLHAEWPANLAGPGVAKQ
jgi:hypothetical protein